MHIEYSIECKSVRIVSPHTVQPRLKFAADVKMSVALITIAAVSLGSVLLSPDSALPGLCHLHVQVVALLSGPLLQLLQGGLQPLAAEPGVAVLGDAANHHERLQHIDDVIDAPSLHAWQNETRL